VQINNPRNDNLSDLESRIEYTFKDKLLLKQALTHTSHANEQMINRPPSYERIEFLGDAVLDLITGEYLMDTYPQMAEGELTKTRAQTVCEPALAHCAKDLELGQYILLGKGEEHSGGRSRDSIIADVMEALIGAIYRDGGLDAAKKFVFKFILSDLADKNLFHDSKSTIQEYIMKNGLGKLRYELSSVSGPEHNKAFHINLFLEDQKIGSGSGKSKKAAEQQAASQAMKKINTERQ